MSDILKWLQNMANEEWEYEDGDYALEAIKFFNSLRAENKKLREALKPFAALGRLAKKLDDNTPCKTTIMSGHLRAAAAALEGVTEPPL